MQIAGSREPATCLFLRQSYIYYSEATTDTKEAGPAPAAERLLDGEHPATVDLADARHWRQVYSELVRFTEETRALAQQSQAALLPEGAGELDSDLQLITRQLDRLRRRLDFWTQKVGQLAPDSQPVA